MGQLLLKRSYGKVESLGIEALQRFGDYIKVCKSQGTARVYVAAVRRFLMVVDDVFAPSQKSVNDWVRVRRSTVEVNTWNQDLAAVRAFYRWAVSWEYAHQDRVPALPRSQRPPQRLVRYLDEWQVGQLLAAPDLSTVVGFRDHVILRLLYETGMRASEVVALELGSLLSDNLIFIQHGKGDKDRYVPHSKELAHLFNEWVRLRRTTRPGKRAALFVTHRGKPLANGNSIWIIVNRYTHNALGLARGFEKITQTAKRKPWQGHYPHLLRASFATAMLQNGCDIRSIQELLGHSDPSTTAKYIGVDLNMLKHEITKLPRSSFGC